MTEFKNGVARMYVDTALFIYYLEHSSLFFHPARVFFRHCYQKMPLVTSAVTLEEYCTYPYANHDLQSIENFKTFLTGMNVSICSVNQEIALEAARLRACHEALKALDALHLATAIITKCKAFITNDKRLQTLPEIQVVTLEQFNSQASISPLVAPG
ncbi:MAG: PIN domain-containing protein [Victivallales bacterium]|nr:PIN domain-containing protein [Victivallales bacterium]